MECAHSYYQYKSVYCLQCIFTFYQIGPRCEHVINMEVSEAIVAINVSNSTIARGPVPVRQIVFGSHTELTFDYCIYRGIALLCCLLLQP